MELILAHTHPLGADSVADLAMFIVRVALGLTVAAHGYNKVFGGGGIKGTAGWFDSIGMRPGKMHAVFAATGEMASGLLLAFGLLTSFASMGMVGLMCVAAWVVHRHNGFFIIKEGWEYTFVIKVVAIVIAMLGPGDWSIDNAIGINDSLDGYTGLIISAAGGAAAAIMLLAIFYRPPKAEAEAGSEEEAGSEPSESGE